MQAKGVRRYRPGKTPEYAKDNLNNKGVRENLSRQVPTSHYRSQQARSISVAELLPCSSDEEDEDEDFLKSKKEKKVVNVTHNNEESSQQYHSVSVAELLTGDSSEGDEDEDNKEEEMKRRRARARARAVMEEDEEMGKEDEEDGFEGEEEDEGSWETETSSEEEKDDDYFTRRPVITPLFVRKEARETIKEREHRELQEAEREAHEEEKKKEKVAESRALLAETLVREKEEELLEGYSSSEEDEDEGEDEDDETMYEKWKIRELQRIKREQEERMLMEQEARDKERRSKMTDEEIIFEDRATGKLKIKEKKKWKYLQKYYHKGAFYQDSDVHSKENYDEATGEDTVDKSLLPSVMQVKNFGRAGRTKYTHLVAEDTTYASQPKWTSPHSQEGRGGGEGGGEGGGGALPGMGSVGTGYKKQDVNPWMVRSAHRTKYNQKMGGMGSVDNPFNRNRKKRKDTSSST